MKYAQTLIDKARQSRSMGEIARSIGMSHANLRSAQVGRRPMPPGLVARLAAICGEDPRKAALIAVCEAEEDEEKRRTLARVLNVELPDFSQANQEVSGEGDASLMIMSNHRFKRIRAGLRLLHAIGATLGRPRADIAAIPAT